MVQSNSFTPLNGSALALPRVLAGILENYQTPKGLRFQKYLSLILDLVLLIKLKEHFNDSNLTESKFCEVFLFKRINPSLSGSKKGIFLSL